ncbi:MAG: acyl-CoA dehydratase activase [Armatimonadota bacterium]|nr:acyl-CoA dehydratase activase [Armatimonadota bacterium]
MPEGSTYAVGVDVGSVSVDIAVLDENGEIVETQYIRHHGRPIQTAGRALRETVEALGRENVAIVAATGNAGRLVAERLNALFVNEVVAQSTATGRLHPHARTIIEIGGEDSKLIFLGPTENPGEDVEVADFNMNAMCAAGTGSFLDQQAVRMNLSIEDFGRIALESEHPPRVAGRCSVFAKSDMIHLQQMATPVKDIVAGLCYALVRNFKSTVGSARDLVPPVAFQGGVAANPAIIRAIRDVYELDDDQLIIPEHFGAMGAVGAALRAMRDGAPKADLDAIADLEGHVLAAADRERLAPLRLEKSAIHPSQVIPPQPGEKVPAYLGIDVGSISTNLVVMDAGGRVLHKEYLMTASRPIEAVGTALKSAGEAIGDRVEIRKACTTGSGRYLVGDFVGADVVKNEITAQATGAVHLDPTVDTIFEIGGQDSKYISIDNGVVVDFTMNKVCAAGTGSFLEEQADKLGIFIEEQFADQALSAEAPANLGERCTVFMESELLKHQQAGVDTPDLVAGLAYSIVYNYLNRVVEDRRVGDNIFFQGGTAFNRAVVAAFESVTGKRITVPPHNENTGAIGCALIAREHDDGQGSDFRGFDLSDVEYTIESFECKGCPNRCEINKVSIAGEPPLFYGDRCGRYQTREADDEHPDMPDLFAERDQMLEDSYHRDHELPEDAPRVGMPRSLLFFELYPFWKAFFNELECEIVVSKPTNKAIAHTGAERSVAETCFPQKLNLGHVLTLLDDEQLDYLFLPSVINLPCPDERMTDSFVCSYIQSVPYHIKSCIDFDEHDVTLLEPHMWMAHGERHVAQQLAEVGRELGASGRQVRQAVQRGFEALERFEQMTRERGQEVLQQLGEDERAVVIVSRSYNGCDPGANLEIPQKLRKMGVLAIPMDFLPLDDVKLPTDWFNMYWRYGQKILSAGEIIVGDDRLFPLYLTNFACGPDSFIMHFFRERIGEKPTLIIEVDEHSADAGMITRCEAFLDSLEATRGRDFVKGRHLRPLGIDGQSHRTMLIPNMSDHAYALAAAFEHQGMPAEVLPEPDEETLKWGRRYTSGKECFPAIVTTGDMVKFVKQDGFDRDTYAFFMGGSGGPCRFGQYNTLQRMVLDDLGYEDVPIYAPHQGRHFFDELGIVGRDFLRVAWQGLVAVDMLFKALLETRPYEVEPGAAQRVYDACLHDLLQTVQDGGNVVAEMRRARQHFEQVQLDRSEPKPVVGLTGEFYIRANAFSNQHLIDKIEKLGGEVWMAPVYEWFLYRNYRRDMRAKLDGEILFRLKNRIEDEIMTRDEHALAQPWQGFLRNVHEPPTSDVLEMACDYVHRSFEGEAVMTVGKAVDFIQKGLHGVVTVMPFTCMPGTISHAILKRVRTDYGDFPALNMVYDGDEQATDQTRLEAFMHQATEFMRRAGPILADRQEMLAAGH